ncbi:MAG: peptidylprolyl isomerase [Verrucomicrobiota bacterium]
MRVEPNTVVGIDFTMKDSKGAVLESSEGKGPLEYLHGVGLPIPPGLIQAIEGMSVGESKSVTIAPELAFGNVEPGLVAKIDRSVFGQNPLAVGMQFHADLDQITPEKKGFGARRYVIKEITTDSVTVDGNYDLAGQTLHFDIKVVSVRAAEMSELAHGHPHQAGGCCGGGGCGSEEGSEGGCCGGGSCSEESEPKSEGGCGSGGCGCSH